MKKDKRVVYYKDEKNDDFMNTKTRLNVNVDGSYNYMPNSVLFKFFSFVFYYIIAFPLLSLGNLLFFGLKVKGRKNLRKLRRQGFFIFANHTHFKDSWLVPVNILPLRKSYIVANKDAVEIPIVNHLVRAAGALPVADTIVGLKNMQTAIGKIIVEKKQVVTIFPEAHIWPYYTKVRDFPLTSFKFASKTFAPAVPVAVCYKKRWLFGNKRRPRAYAFIGEPIYPKVYLTEKENTAYLRDKTYDFIKNTTEKESNYEYIKYIRKIDEDEFASNKEVLAEEFEILNEHLDLKKDLAKEEIKEVI